MNKINPTYRTRRRYNRITFLYEFLEALTERLRLAVIPLFGQPEFEFKL